MGITIQITMASFLFLLILFQIRTKTAFKWFFFSYEHERSREPIIYWYIVVPEIIGLIVLISEMNYESLWNLGKYDFIWLTMISIILIPMYYFVITMKVDDN